MKKIFQLLKVSLLSSLVATAQVPDPGKMQTESILLTGAILHIGDGTILENGAIGFDNGKISYVGKAGSAENPKFKNVINVSGKHIYPGFIVCGSYLGLTEIDLVRSTRDYNEVGEFNPHIRSIIAYNTDSRIIPTVRNNGVLYAQAVPEGGIVSGLSSVVQLDAWNWEDAAYSTDIGIHLNWPRMYVRKSGNKEAEEKQRENIKSTLEKIEQFFKEAQAYYKSNPEERNVRFEAMKGLFDGSKKLFVHTDYIKSMEAAVLFSKQFNMNMVLVGGADSWMMASFLKQNNIPVILGRSHSLPPREDDDTDLPYKLPSLLQQAGVKFVIGNDGSWQTRNLAFQAGTAAAFGLSKEEALRAITLSAAEVLGIDQTTGSLSVGKDASLIVSAGDMLDMRSNAVEQAYINGRPVNLDDVQKQLYRKYMNKYGLK